MIEKEIIERYGKSHLFSIGFSGGKDSTATLLYLTKVLRLPNIKACFADTGWESKETYEYLNYVEIETGIEIIRLSAQCGQVYKKENKRVPDPLAKMGMKELCKIKERFPSSQRRFCTTELKLKVQKDWIEKQDCQIINVSGVRREESQKRKNAAYFSLEDQFMNVPIWLPIVDWTWQQVFDIHKQFDLQPNPLYKKGFSRVGCFPCIMACKSELNLIALNYPERFDEMLEMENDVAAVSRSGAGSFFSADTVSKAYRRQECSGISYANALDVKDWALGKCADVKTSDMFSDDDFDDVESPACNSIYGLCE